MVPVITFAFSISKGFGLYENLHTDVIEPILMTWLELERLPELSEAFSQLISFIETTDLRSLGLVGFITVAYSVIRLMSAVEESLNDIWGAPSARSFVRKVSDYLSVSLVVPILLLVGATGSTAFHLDDAIAAMEAWGWFGALLVRFGVLVVVWLGFMVIYMIMPNISIQPRAAAYGGVVGGSLWLLVHQAHVSLQVGVANYNALYAGFSAFPIFMIWVYASWVSLLLGAVLPLLSKISMPIGRTSSEALCSFATANGSACAFFFALLAAITAESHCTPRTSLRTNWVRPTQPSMWLLRILSALRSWHKAIKMRSS